MPVITQTTVREFIENAGMTGVTSNDIAKHFNTKPKFINRSYTAEHGDAFDSMWCGVYKLDGVETREYRHYPVLPVAKPVVAPAPEPVVAMPDITKPKITLKPKAPVAKPDAPVTEEIKIKAPITNPEPVTKSRFVNVTIYLWDEFIAYGGHNTMDTHHPLQYAQIDVRLTECEKARIVAETYAGAGAVRATAIKHGIHSTTLSGWRKQVKLGSLIPDNTPIDSLKNVFKGDMADRIASDIYQDSDKRAEKRGEKRVHITLKQAIEAGYWSSYLKEQESKASAEYHVMTRSKTSKA